MREPIHLLSQRIGHQFEDQSLLEQALTHRSAGSANNERQEFLGDAILGFVVADELYRRFPEADEGRLSRLRAGLVKRETLAAVARQLELGKYLALGPGELRTGGHARDSTLADALEALFAAVYQDAGYQAARRMIRALLQSRLDALAMRALEKDPKTRLQELLQSRRLPLPDYQVIEVSGEQHQQQFTVNCRVAGSTGSTTGSGSSRRKAEQAAAKEYLALMQQQKHG